MSNRKDQPTDSFMTRRLVYIWLPEVMSLPSAKWDSMLVQVLSISTKAALEERLYQKIYYSGTGVNDQIIQSYISALFRFYSCFCRCFILKHMEENTSWSYWSLAWCCYCVQLSSSHLSSFLWGCSCNNLMGENKPPPAVANYKRKISQSLEERIVVYVPPPWEKEDEGWSGLCWAEGRDWSWGNC